MCRRCFTDLNDNRERVISFFQFCFIFYFNFFIESSIFSWSMYSIESGIVINRLKQSKDLDIHVSIEGCKSSEIGLKIEKKWKCHVTEECFPGNLGKEVARKMFVLPSCFVDRFQIRKQQTHSNKEIKLKFVTYTIVKSMATNLSTFLECD